MIPPVIGTKTTGKLYTKLSAQLEGHFLGDVFFGSCFFLIMKVGCTLFCIVKSTILDFIDEALKFSFSLRPSPTSNLIHFHRSLDVLGEEHSTFRILYW